MSDGHSSKSFSLSFRSNEDEDSYKPPTPSIEKPQTPFTSIHTGNRPLPFNLPDTMNMMTTDAQLEERRRAAIREREREAQAKERNKQLLAKRREDQLRLKHQMEEEAKMRETLVKEAEARRIGAIESTRFDAINKIEEEERVREEVALGLCSSVLNTKAVTSGC
jgi:hypothetical protein